MRKLVSIAGALLTLAAAPAMAQDGSLNTEIQHFHPTVDGQGVVVSESAATLDLGKPAFGVLFNYGSRPLMIFQVDSETGQVQESNAVIANQFAMDVQAAIGFRYASLGVNLPLNLAMNGDDNLPGGLQPVSGFSLGDLRIIPKFRLVDPLAKKFGVAIAVPIAVPTGNPELNTGDPTVRIIPTAVLGYQSGRFRIFLNAGAVIRPGVAKHERGFDELRIGNEFLFSLGLGVKAHPMVEVNGEIWGNIGGPANGNPVEWALGTTINPIPLLNIRVGIGTALSQGYGAPVFRAYFGAGVAFFANDDADADGVVDKVDQCPAEMEDKDGFEDADGCPDPDNDNDGILDVDDQCPRQAETLNGFDDEDGCPDESEDDVVDAPEEELPEDVDSDGDGVPDIEDECESDREDPDGFMDEDGCPDLDNDDDGIADALDDCPMEAEVFNLIDDADGCPDEGGLAVIERKDGKIAKIAILEKVYFETGKDVIKTESYPVLDAVASLLEAYEEIKVVEVQGHTDSDGSASANLDLSQRRANAVKTYIEGKGIPADRMVAKGYGEELPVDTNDTADGKANNRRVEFVVLEQD